MPTAFFPGGEPNHVKWIIDPTWYKSNQKKGRKKLHSINQSRTNMVAVIEARAPRRKLWVYLTFPALLAPTGDKSLLCCSPHNCIPSPSQPLAYSSPSVESSPGVTPSTSPFYGGELACCRLLQVPWMQFSQDRASCLPSGFLEGPSPEPLPARDPGPR